MEVFEKLIRYLTRAMRLYQEGDKEASKMGVGQYYMLRWVVFNNDLLKDYQMKNKKETIMDLLTSFSMDNMEAMQKGAKEMMEGSFKETVNVMSDSMKDKKSGDAK